MRLILSFEGVDNSIKLPIDYNLIIQSFIYNHISEELASFLHEEGYFYGKRSFKLFTFSRLFGKYELIGNHINFKSSVKLHISSAVDRFIQELAETMVKRENLKLWNNEVNLTTIEVCPSKRFDEEVKIKTLSPITVYSTLTTKEGRKKTYYYSPFEKEFSGLILENLKKKFELVHKKKSGEKVFTIKPLNKRYLSEKILKYKGTIIKGWMGKFKLKGSPSLISIAYDTGLGSKNSQGFGMFEMVGK